MNSAHFTSMCCLSSKVRWLPCINSSLPAERWSTSENFWNYNEMLTNGYATCCWQAWSRDYGAIMPFWRPAVGLGYSKCHYIPVFWQLNWALNATVKQQAHIKSLIVLKIKVMLQFVSLNFNNPGAKYWFLLCVTINLSLTPLLQCSNETVYFPAGLSHNTTSQKILNMLILHVLFICLLGIGHIIFPAEAPLQFAFLFKYGAKFSNSCKTMGTTRKPTELPVCLLSFFYDLHPAGNEVSTSEKLMTILNKSWRLLIQL